MKHLLATAFLALTTLGLGSVLASQTPPDAQGAAMKPDAQAATMKAVRMHDYGDASVLKLEDAPKPVAKDGEVIVRVVAAGVNPVDWKIRKGAFKGVGELPLILGYDVSGVVDSIGGGPEGGGGFAVGDEVYAMLDLQEGGGYAEYAKVAAKKLAKKPTTIDHVHAAGLPVAALTAWQALIDTAKLDAGQTVLIHGAAGGVGHMAVQIAKWKGAKVIATGSATSHEFLKKLGADVTIDYKTQKFEELVRDVDVVLDTIGGDTAKRSYPLVKKGGFFVSIVGQPPGKELDALGIQSAGILVQPSAKELTRIAELVDAKKLTVEVSETFALADAAKAHEKSEGGHVRGKLVLKVR